MTDLILVYTTWSSVTEAKSAARILLRRRLCGCVNIFPNVNPMFWWPPKSNKIDESEEVVMIIKTIKSKYQELEKEICKIHSFETPCVVAIPVTNVNKDYYSWIKEEIKKPSK